MYDNFALIILIYNREIIKGEIIMRTDILERKNDILQWIEENQSKAFMCKELSCK